MALREASVPIVSLLFLFAVTFSPSAVSAQNLSKTVLPITELKWIGPGMKADFGTGFCLDPGCRFIGSNYHVVATTQPSKIKGEKVIYRYLATGPDDDGATVNQGSAFRNMKYTLSRDLAIFELRNPLPHYHGIPFSLSDLHIGQEVDIYTYPKEPINPIRNLVRSHGAFKGETTDGLLAFDYSPSNGKLIGPGASGGLVVDSKTQQIVGVFNGIAKGDERIAVAVPVQSLANFVSKVQPWLAESLFPSANKRTMPFASADLYPKFVPPAPSGVLQHRPDEPPEVVALRKKAQDLTDSIRNFIAVQSYEWGSANKAPPAAWAEYEIRVVDGAQRFRKLPGGKKELPGVERPSLLGFMTPANEWSELPRLVGMDPRLKINYAGEAVVSDRRVKVFQYYASLEDGLCPFASEEDYLFFVIRHYVSPACFGEVWTDADANVLRISENLDLSQRLRSYRGWKEVRVVVTYGWLQQRDEPSRLAPLTLYSEAQEGKHTYWCRGLFTDYRIFESRARIVSASSDHM